MVSPSKQSTEDGRFMWRVVRMTSWLGLTEISYSHASWGLWDSGYCGDVIMAVGRA